MRGPDRALPHGYVGDTAPRAGYTAGVRSPPPVPAAPPPVRVFIVEDTVPIRAALEYLLNATPGFACVGVAGAAEAVLEDPPEAPDVVLLDVGLPGMSGIEALRPLRRTWPRAEFLMLTVHDDAERVYEALCAGATGYLVKTTPPAQILDAIRSVFEGGAPMSASVARKVVQTFRRPEMQDDGLSKREQEVLDRLMDGKTYRQIAAELFVSVNTVGFHVKQVYAKLHVNSRAEAVGLALRRRA